MIARNAKLLNLLKEARELVIEQHKEAETSNDDLFHLNEAIGIVESRLAYLKNQAATKKADKKKDGDKVPAATKKAGQKPVAAEQANSEREEFKTILREEHAAMTIEQLTESKAAAQDLVQLNAEDADAKLLIEVIDELIAGKTSQQ